jgi:hypothetical protein
MAAQVYGAKMSTLKSEFGKNGAPSSDADTNFFKSLDKSKMT